jgi:nucleotide-binding universal stress UspA family protein
MKKIISAFDGLRFSPNTLHYAIAIAKQTNTFLVGIFLEDFTYTSYKMYDLITKEGVSEKELRQYADRDKSTRDQAVADFETACREAGIQYSVHHDKNIALQELLHESIYADLLIIDSHETFSHYEDKLPTRFIRELLPAVQCPVLLVPQQYKPVEKITLLYDGGLSSVHAIKIFGYLFPVLSQLPVEVISVKGFYDDQHVPDNRLMKEYMKRHFPNTIFTILKGHADMETVKHLHKEKQAGLVVLGAYKRGSVSRWLKQSMADILMQEIQAPLFIAHNK